MAVPAAPVRLSTWRLAEVENLEKSNWGRGSTVGTSSSTRHFSGDWRGRRFGDRGTLVVSRPLKNWSLKSFWEGSEHLLHRVVEDLSAVERSGTFSQIASALAPAIDAAAEVPRTELLAVLAVLAAGLLYITASPGVLLGALDTYVGAPFQLVLDALRGRKTWNASDFVLGEWIGEGSFGTVYSGALLSKNQKASNSGKRIQRMEDINVDSKVEKVVLKKVKVRVEGAVECAEMEEFFNSRVQRAAAGACAEYLGSFVSNMSRGQFVEGGKWLVWKYEGTLTLASFMKQPNFPGNLEEALFGPKGLIVESDPVLRTAILTQKIIRQILISVKKLHAIGIVHRDIKPSNLVVTQTGGLKIIDLGAAVDLRTGRNFNPDRGMLDPDYCPPELYVMSEKTPRPPVAPLAALLSPFLYVINSPDLFDTYSVGVILMQLACSALRTPIGLQNFKSEMEAVNYDLDEWRRSTKTKAYFDVLDLDGGKAWDLARKLLCKRGILKRGRLSAASALRHPYFFFGRDQVASFLCKITPAKKKGGSRNGKREALAVSSRKRK